MRRLRACLLGLLFLIASLPACGKSDAIVVIALHPKNPDIFYVATNDYIYKTRDGGKTWENISRGMSHSRVIAMTIDPQYPATVYAGTKGDAIYKSYDGGQRWVSQRSGLDDVTISSVVNQFVFDPLDHESLFVATTMGVFESRNGGDSWQKRMDGMKEVLMVVTLAMDPARRNVLYAGTSGGVYKSVDRAMKWQKVNNGLVPPDVVKSSRALGVTVMQIDPYNQETVYAATLNGIYKTTDGGQGWTRIGESLPDQMISAMVLDRSTANVIYAASRQGVHRSEDGGATWRALNEGVGSLNVRSLVQSPTDPRMWYVGTNGSGLYRSDDRGEHWVSVPPVTVSASQAAH